MKKLIIVILFLFSVKMYSQKIDTTYYVKLPNKDLVLSTSVNRSILHLRVMEPKNRTYFLPNEIMTVSVGVSHPKIPVDVSIGTGFGGYRKEFPKTKSLDILINKYARKFVIDASYRKYKGFYIDNYVNNLINKDLTFEQRSFPDLDLLLIGVFGQYVFNGNKFSYQSAFNNNQERQLRSAGSILAGASSYYFKMDSEKQIINDIDNLEQIQFGLNGGYGYNWVINSKWMIHGSASGGVNFTPEFKIKPMYLIRGSCFYKGEKWSTGVTAVANIITLIEKKGLKSRFDSGMVGLTVIRRIKLKNKN